MLFPPPGEQPGPASSWPSRRVGCPSWSGQASADARPRGTSRCRRCRTAPGCRCSASTRTASSPVRTCAGTGSSNGETRHGRRLVDPLRHRRGHGRGRPPDPDRRRVAAGLRLVTELESLVGGGLRARHTLTNTAPGTYVVDGLEVVLPAGDHLDRGPRLHRPPRARAQPAAAPGHRRPVVARGARRPARSRRREHGGARHRGLLHDPRRGVRRARRLERQHRAARRAIGGHRDDRRRRRAPPARRGDPRAGRDVLDALGVLRRGRRRARRPRRRVAHLAAFAAEPPGRAARRAERVGGRLLRPRPRPAQGHRRTGRPGGRRALRARRRVVPAPTRRLGRPRGLVGRRDRVARRPGRAQPAGGARPRARHEVRALVRARDGQPRLRPLPRPPRLGARHRRPGAAAGARPAGARPDPARGLAARLRADGRRAVGVPDRLREVGPQPRPARGRLRRRRRSTRRARPDAGLLPAARRVARARTPTSPGSRAPRGAAGSTSESPRRCSGSGPPT